MNAHDRKDGKHVNYEALGASPLFTEYREQCEQLTTIDLGALSLPEKKAFCLNVYNTLLIHAFVDIGAPHNSASRLKFFTTAAYDIGGHVYSLNDIEHGILRGNSKHMGAVAAASVCIAFLIGTQASAPLQRTTSGCSLH